jgi:hypothetical protein
MFFSSGLKKQAVTIIAVALWIPTVAFGISVLWKYSVTPGRPGTPPADWPANAPIQRTGGRSALVMFVHPRCECSSATLGELAIIMAHTPAQLDADVFFYSPASEAGSWVRTGLWNTANAIPGVRVHVDRDAAIAQSFGAFTSGQTLLYDPRGRLQFRGGITAFRGHSGDNAGRSAISALLLGKTPSSAAAVMTPVLGCSLRGE